MEAQKLNVNQLQQNRFTAMEGEYRQMLDMDFDDPRFLSVCQQFVKLALGRENTFAVRRREWAAPVGIDL